MRRFFLLSLLSLAAVLFILDLDVSGSFGNLRRLAEGDVKEAENEKICITPELNGEWVESKPPDDMNVSEARSFEVCQNFTDEFQWKVAGMAEWDPNAFCRILGNRTIAVIGDSTMRQSAVVLTGMVRLGGCMDQIIFRYADTLVFENMGGLNRGAYWTTWVRHLRPDIVVVSAGAHIMDEANFTRVFDAAMADIEEIEKEQPDIQFVWKTQNPAGGHPSRQVSLNERLTGHPTEAAPRRANDPNFKLWNHNKFWSRDNTILPQLQKRGIPFLDMRMLYNRVDAHPWRSGDCLHFCLPGPLRIFPLLLQRLMENEFAVSNCLKMK